MQLSATIRQYCCLWILLVFTSAQAQTPLASDVEIWSMSLAEAQEYAINHNAEAVNAQLETQRSEGVVQEFKALGLPQVNGSVEFNHFFDIPTSILPDFISPSVYGVLTEEGLVDDSPTDFGPGIPAQFGTKNTINAGLTANQLVYSGTYNLGLKAIKTYLERSKLDLSQKKIDVREQVANAYFGVKIIEENLKLLESSKTNLNKILFETKALNENGFIEEIEVDRLRLSLANIDTQIDNIERQRKASLEGLKLMMGMRTQDQLILTEELEGYINNNTNLLAEKAQIQNRIENRMLLLQAQFDTLEIKKVRSEYFPELVAFGNIGRSFQADDLKVFDSEWYPTALVGLTLSVPIFDGFRKKGVMNQKKVAQLQNNNTRMAFDKVFNVEVSTARAAYANALESMRNQKNNLQLADKIYRVSKIKYNEGLGSSLELTAAESQQNETRALYVQSLYELVLAINQLKKSLGKL